ncbi:MAG TPA: hypothetical protein VHX20_18015 [Terracidiphilus sp.]|jgi:hypothetical protein|nr:hypothetical protein [Terracidiphilus sp.]
MRKAVVILSLLVAAAGLAGAQTVAQAAAPAAPADWKATLAQRLPLMGHRNWILIADSAYPLQVSPGIETIETNADQADVVRYVLKQIDDSIHVRPEIFMDAELPFVPDQDAPGASDYRKQIAEVLRGYKVDSELHDKLIAEMGQSGLTFHVLVLKTNLTVPYTSVFIRLNCKYWPTDAENRMRARMSAAKP